jgi:NADPH:quinone reductase-like Zn-dependent oxidoreductase
MKAITLKEPGGIENLIIKEIPDPILNEGEILVQVKAISINPVDAKTRAGKGVYGKIKDNDPVIIGWDISGIVKDRGHGANKFDIGDEVFGMVNFPGHGKAYAEYVAAPESHLAKKPSNISHDEAAAATLAALTAWQGLTTHAQIKRGDRILVHAASGGVGHFVVQMAKHLGAYVIGTSSAENRKLVLSLGADEHVDYKAVRFEEVVKEMDYVFETVGGENINRSLDTLKKGGAVISILGPGTEATAEKAKQLGVQVKPFLVSSNGDDMKIIAKLLEEKQVRSHIDSTFSFEHMGKAHAQVETGRTKGKVIVTV